MTAIAVAYHAEFGRNARPAINVKMHVAGTDLWPRAFDALPVSADGAQEIGRTTAADLVDAAYNIVTQDFWADAAALAVEHGLGEIGQEGRSGGWLVFPDLRYRLPCPEHEALDTICDDETEALEGYRAMSEWAAGFVAVAPARIAALAQSLAMDELGASTVNQVQR